MTKLLALLLFALALAAILGLMHPDPIHTYGPAL